MKIIKSLRFKLVFCFLAICFSKAYSQEDTMLFTKGFLDSINIDDLLRISKPKSYFKIQASYLSNAVYAGRKDSLAIPYLTPVLEYNHKSGVYASVSASFLSNSNYKLDVWSLDAGYSFDTSHHFGGSIYVNKIFYADSSKNVQSTVNFSLGGTLTYIGNIINISASPSLMFGSKTDFALILSADHTFNWGDDSSYNFSLTPSIATYFGSTGYYQNYTYKRRNGNGVPQNVTISITSPNKFQMLSYEFSLPISYDKNKWGIFFTPTLAIPVNAVTTSVKATGPNGGNLIFSNLNIPRSETEKISNSFFAELGFYFRF